MCSDDKAVPNPAPEEKTEEEATKGDVSSALGALSDELRRLRSIHLLIVLISVIALYTFSSLGPYNERLRQETLGLLYFLPSEAAQDRGTYTSADYFYDLIFGDQISERKLGGRYGDEFEHNITFVAADPEFQIRSRDETLRDTLNYLQTLSVDLLVDVEAIVEAQEAEAFEAWKSVVQNAGMTVTGERIHYADWLKRAFSHRAYRCFETEAGACERMIGDKKLEGVLAARDQFGDKVFILPATIRREQINFSMSDQFIAHYTSEIQRMIDEVGDLKMGEIIAKNYSIGRLNAPPPKLPLLGLDVDVELFFPFLLGVMVVMQIYFVYEVGSMARFAKHIEKTWQNRPVFYAPWIGARPSWVEILTTGATVAALPAIAFYLISSDYVTVWDFTRGVGYRLEQLENVYEGAELFAEIVAVIASSVLFLITCLSLTDADQARKLSFGG